MLANGVPPKVAAERLGHADPTPFTNLSGDRVGSHHRHPRHRPPQPEVEIVYKVCCIYYWCDLQQNATTAGSMA